MSSTPTPTDPERGEGKGSNDDDDDDPAEDFEDDPDSEAAADAQQTLDEIDAEVTTSEGDESESPSTAESGTSDAGNADVASGTGDVESGTSDANESGRYGLTSNPEVRENAFSEAVNTQTARDAGIDDGQTTAHDMEVLELEDGSEAYATPVSTYPTIVVESEEAAINNNLRSPKVVDDMGGNSCEASLVEGPDGDQYIVKEGVDGDLVRQMGDRAVPPDVDDLSDEVAESGIETLSAAYFTGNRDLHGANLKVDSNGTVTVIDNDSGGKNKNGSIANIQKFAENSRVGVDGEATRHRIYDKAHELQSGERSLSVSQDTDHHEYAHEAAEKAIRASYVDSSYDAPSGNRPANMQSAPDGYTSFDDFEDVDTIRYVNDKGEITRGEIRNISSLSITVKDRVNRNDIRLTDEDNLNRIIEIE